MASNLDRQTRYVAGVLNIPFEQVCEGVEEVDYIALGDMLVRLRTVLDCFAWRWFLAPHYAFSDEELLEGVKQPHIHFVFEAPKRARLLTWIIRLQRALGYERNQRNLISVEPVTSLPLSVQYLIHANHLEKYQFPRDIIQTNVDKAELDYLLDSDGGYLDTQRIIALCRECPNKADIILEIGLDVYMRYRPIFSDIWPIFHGNTQIQSQYRDPPVKIPHKAN